MREIHINLPDLAATEHFGRTLGAALWPGAVVGLVGELGAGKTHLTRAIAAGLGLADLSQVSSPTFGLIHEYPARCMVYHFDAYRLTSVAAFEDLGVYEYFTAGGVCVIEWADRVLDVLPAERLIVTLRAVSATAREAALVAVGKRYIELVAALAQ